MATSQQFLRLVQGYSSQRESVSRRVASQITSAWDQTNPYVGSEMKSFVEQSAFFMTAAQQQIVFQTTSLQKAAFDLLDISGLDDFVPDVPDEVRLYSPDGYEYASPVKRRTSAGVTNRLPVDEVFNRPAREYRYLRSIGKPEKESLDTSKKRVRIIVETNLALAQREAESQLMQEIPRRGKSKSRVLGWRRVIHPEASKSGVCGLCIAAANRVYSTDDLKDLHDYCKCTVLPITQANDPGLSLNKSDFKTLYGPDGKTANSYLRQLSFQVEDHGELGRILVPSQGQGVIHFNQKDATSELEAA